MQTPPLLPLTAMLMAGGILACAAAPEPQAPAIEQAFAPSAPQGGFAGGQKNAAEADLDDEAGAHFAQAEKAFDGRAKREERPEPEVAETAASTSDRPDSAPARAWFPETFLFVPELVTDANGQASHQQRIPDRLTTYRVLGLAHDQHGHQAGAVARLRTNLPLFADPVLPERLRVGDRFRFAVPVVNTTDEPQPVTVVVQSEGLDVRGGGALTVPAQGSAMVWVDGATAAPGTATLDIQVHTDGTVRDRTQVSIPVSAVGAPQVTHFAGTLGSPRSHTLTDPYAGTAHITVLPGGIGVIRSEVTQVTKRAAGPLGAALMLSVAEAAPGFWEAAGVPVDPASADPASRARADEVRTLRLLGVQRAQSEHGEWSLDEATALARAAVGDSDDPVLSRLAVRAIETLTRIQRPDGTFGGDTSGTWTVQRILVATASALSHTRNAPTVETARALRAMHVRGQAALERWSPRITDPYTASALLATGADMGDETSRLQAILKESLQTAPEGTTIRMPEGVLRADGRVATAVDAACMAVPALITTQPNLAADLGATVVAAFVPANGWGDPLTDLTCIHALRLLGATTTPAQTQLVLRWNGEIRESVVLQQNDLLAPIVLEATSPGQGTWTLESEPALPGLAYHLAVTTTHPWTTPRVHPGIAVEVDAPRLQVGAPAPWTAQISAPRDTPVILQVALPAGVTPVLSSLQVTDGAGVAPQVEATPADGALDVTFVMPTTGRAIVSVDLLAMLSGEMWDGGMSVEAKGEASRLPPRRWSIASR